MSFKRLLFFVKVEGLSCWPYLRPGQKYLATSLSRPKAGDFVVFRDESRGRFLVKKVVAKEKDSYRVTSTLPLAQISDNFRLVPITSIVGKLLGLPRVVC
jgi:phage repressor protein C with HTH and peptisase S24 domain